MLEEELDLVKLGEIARLAELDMDASQSRALWFHRVVFDPPTVLRMVAKLKARNKANATLREAVEALEYVRNTKANSSSFEHYNKIVIEKLKAVQALNE